MEYVAGFIIRYQDSYLICHGFGNPWANGRWSLPKGHIEEGENALQAALRETFEETNLNLESIEGKITRLGTYKYPDKNKKITIFLFDSKKDIRKNKIECNSYFKNGKNKGFPEIDLCLWVSKEEAIKKLHPSTHLAFQEIDNI